MIASLYPPFRHWSEHGTIWIYSDTHFGESLPFPGRPSDEEHVKRINARAGKHDTLILLGDVGDIEYAKRLRAHKILILGNHDAGASNYEGIFEEVYTGPVFISDKILLSHEPLEFPYALNIHGHNHSLPETDKMHYNACADVCGYEPLNFNQFIKSGALAHVPSVHRDTINRASERARKRGFSMNRKVK